ncbi:MAG TPA: hypothetical protein VG387_12640, partial [Rhizomicrobium sp.]|nr:hypothetical protein [Rhizomicrobium sp.]
PRIASIYYASPGALELTLILSIAFNVREIVKVVASTIKTANSAYSDVVKGMQRRKLMRLKGKREELKLRAAELSYIAKCNETMSSILQIGDLQKINSRTGHSYRTLKILLSLYRRIRTLAEYQNKGKADFTRQQGEQIAATVATSQPPRAANRVKKVRRR